MLETHIVMSSFICRLVLILVFRLALTLVLHLAYFHVLCLALHLMLCLNSLMDLTIAHMVFGPRENRFVPRHFGYDPRPHRGDHFPRRLVFLLEGLTLTLSRDTWTFYAFLVMVHVPLGQMVSWKGL
jgi:hypothetical protein